MSQLSASNEYATERKSRVKRSAAARAPAIDRGSGSRFGEVASEFASENTGW